MKKYVLIILLISQVAACKDDNVIYQARKIDNSGWKDTLELVNRSLIIIDKERIDAYVNRRNWNMKETESGLYYEIFEKGKGEKAQKGLIGKIKYRVELLDGTFCYSSDSTGIKTLKIGQGSVEGGLDKALLMMRKGDKARIILLPHLAHGLLGDFEKIPARSILVYYVELVELIDF